MSQTDYEKSCGICGMIPHHSKCRVRELETKLAEANAALLHMEADRDGCLKIMFSSQHGKTIRELQVEVIRQAEAWARIQECEKIKSMLLPQSDAWLMVKGRIRELCASADASFQPIPQAPQALSKFQVGQLVSTGVEVGGVKQVARITKIELDDTWQGGFRYMMEGEAGEEGSCESVLQAVEIQPNEAPQAEVVVVTDAIERCIENMEAEIDACIRDKEADWFKRMSTEARAQLAHLVSSITELQASK